MRNKAHYHLSVGISAYGYPVSDNRTSNCKGVVPSHIKEVKLQLYDNKHINSNCLHFLMPSEQIKCKYHSYSFYKYRILS